MSTPVIATSRREERERLEQSRRAERGAVRGALIAAPGSRAALGGEPRVSLLPPEVNDFHRARTIRRRLVAAVVGVGLLVLAGVAGSYYLALNAQAALTASQTANATLLAQEAEFAELKQIKNSIALVEAGQRVGVSTEINWTQYLGDLQATLPEGSSLNDVTIDSASPFSDFAQSTVPLQGSRVATVTFTATSPTLPSIPVWLDGLSDLKGFSDAVPNSVALQTDGTYLVTITMHLNSEAFALRFAEEDTK